MASRKGGQCLTVRTAVPPSDSLFASEGIAFSQSGRPDLARIGLGSIGSNAG